MNKSPPKDAVNAFRTNYRKTKRRLKIPFKTCTRPRWLCNSVLYLTSKEKIFPAFFELFQDTGRQRELPLVKRAVCTHAMAISHSYEPKTLLILGSGVRDVFTAPRVQLPSFNGCLTLHEAFFKQTSTGGRVDGCLSSAI